MLPAGAMTALGIHVTDLFISFVGRPKSVQAKTAKVLQTVVGVDHVSAQIDFVCGATAALTCLSSTPFHGRIAAYGTRGWIEVRENGNVDKGQPTDVVIADSEGKRTTKSYAATNTVLANFESWAQAASRTWRVPLHARAAARQHPRPGGDRVLGGSGQANDLAVVAPGAGR